MTAPENTNPAQDASPVQSTPSAQDAQPVQTTGPEQPAVEGPAGGQLPTIPAEDLTTFPEDDDPESHVGDEVPESDAPSESAEGTA